MTAPFRPAGGPTLFGRIRGPIVVDLFAGGGGASAGIKAATGFSPAVAVNHCAHAIELHCINHPETHHFQQDVFEVSPELAARGRSITAIWGSPDCFAGGTLVLTAQGYRAIEEVQVGDLVLTHRNRWRPVVSAFSSIKPTVRVDVQGHPDGLVCSEKHKHFAATSKGGPVEQVPSDSLGRGCYIGTPVEVDALPLPADLPDLSPWVLGRYVADGWASPSKGIVLTVGAAKSDAVERELSCESRAWRRRETATAVQFTIYGAALARWLHREFGHLAHGKRLPAWLMGAPREFREEFLRGYTAGDGYVNAVAGCVECTTTSRELAFGLRTLSGSLGYTVSAYRARQHTHAIDGRAIEGQEFIYSVKWRETIADGHCQQWDADGQRFYPVRGVADVGLQRVYNITVEEDHSYVVEGVTTWNCTHFSRAKGGVPLKKEIRGLAWAVHRWAAATQAGVVFLENVEELRTWGPLDADGFPIKAQAGETFAEFTAAMEALGYVVEWKSLSACDYGSPTSRRRLFMVARRDGLPVRWPAPTHGPGRPLPWRTAAECIDWSIPMLSIFATPAEAKAWAKATGADGVPKRPLADATLRRIAEGVRRYVLDAAKPFLVGIDNKSSPSATWPADAPPGTITSKARHAVVAPVLTRYNGERRPGEARGARVDAPLSTVDTSNRHAIVAPVLVANNTNNAPRSAEAPLGTITSGGRHILAAAHLLTLTHGGRLQDPAAPMPTVTGAHRGEHAVVAAFMAKHYGGVVGHDVERPLGTVTAVDHHSPVAVFLDKLHGSALAGQPLDEPAPTVAAGGGRGGGHAALVAAFLCAYYGSERDGQALDEPARTITSKPRLGLVTVTIDGTEYVVVDIAMRMLQPRELARAQGFPDDYAISTGSDTKGDQVARIGNSVCPQVAEALVAANLCDDRDDAVAAK